MPFTTEQRAAVDSCRDLLTENMDARIGMDLYKHNIFSTREHQMIKNEITDEDKRTMILELLITKDPEAWDIWLEKLRQSKQETLAAQLTTALQKQTGVQY